MAKEIHIEGEIYANWGEIISDLAAAKDATIYVNSGGGSVTEGFAMADAIKRHSATNKVEIIGTGIVASIATIILLAASKGNRKMTENSFLMIHNPSAWMDGDAEKMRSMANTLDAMKARLADTYLQAIKSNGKLINNSEADTLAQVIAWMDKETWFTAQQALDAGFIDAVVTAKDYAVNRAVIKNCTNVPDAIKNKLNAMEINEQEKTLFQKFLAFLGFEPKAECKPTEEEPTNIETETEMTEEQMIEALAKAGYTIEKEVEQEKEMTEEEMLATLEASGYKATKAAAPENKAPEASAELIALKAKLEAQREEIARMKQANNAVKVTEQPKTTEGLSRKEAALERVYAENKTKFEEMANGLKKRMG